MMKETKEDVSSFEVIALDPLNDYAMIVDLSTLRKTWIFVPEERNYCCQIGEVVRGYIFNRDGGYGQFEKMES